MKSKKTIERLQRRKEEKAMHDACAKLVNAANSLATPLEDLLPAFTKYKLANSTPIEVSSCAARSLTPIAKEACFQIVCANMQAMYEVSDWGWDAEEKRFELFEEDARYLFCREAASPEKLLGFVHFRFDVEDLTPVVYCYEVQVVESVRGKGLGRFLMQILLLLASKTRMEKVMLTVFKHNKSAVTFFESLKFDIDETDPLKCEMNSSPCYKILSRPVVSTPQSAKA